MLYLAYGSNMIVADMDWRCPNAIMLDTFELNDWRLVFHNFADVVPDPQSSVPAVLWQITESCLASLDHYEGYPHLYNRVMIATPQGDAWMYVMQNNPALALPHARYYAGMMGAYLDLHLRRTPLRLAWEEAYAEEKKQERLAL